MVVILAGNECTGKSTCFSLLRDEQFMNMKYIKESYTSSSTEKVCRMNNISVLQQTKVKYDVLYDRATLIDDVVYSEVIDQHASILPGFQKYSKLLADCVVIYFMCDLDIIRTRLIERGDEYINEQQLQQISECYEKFFRKHKCRLHRIDVSDHSEEQVKEKVKEIIKSEKENESRRNRSC